MSILPLLYGGLALTAAGTLTFYFGLKEDKRWNRQFDDKIARLDALEKKIGETGQIQEPSNAPEEKESMEEMLDEEWGEETVELERASEYEPELEDEEQDHQEHEEYSSEEEDEIDINPDQMGKKKKSKEKEKVVVVEDAFQSMMANEKREVAAEEKGKESLAEEEMTEKHAEEEFEDFEVIFDDSTEEDEKSEEVKTEEIEERETVEQVQVENKSDETNEEEQEEVDLDEFVMEEEREEKEKENEPQGGKDLESLMDKYTPTKKDD